MGAADTWAPHGHQGELDGVHATTKQPRLRDTANNIDARSTELEVQDCSPRAQVTEPITATANGAAAV